MKKSFLILQVNIIKKVGFVLLLSSLYIPICSGQGFSLGIQPSNGEKHYYLGSLRKDSSVPHEKLKVEIFGGEVTNSYGTQVFTISTRGGLKINREIHNGKSSGYDLNIFETQSGFDFTIRLASVWATIWIQSYLLYPNFDGQLKPMSPVNITVYDPTGKNNVTTNYTINTLISTNITGNIGIGTNNPQSTLDIRGKIIANEVEIKVYTGADFVFEPDYILKPLNEVESFIKENKHLPDIPSEKEVIKNGISVGEMQAKLLQKIEELTLYVIDLKKENESIKQELKGLRKE